MCPDRRPAGMYLSTSPLASFNSPSSPAASLASHHPPTLSLHPGPPHHHPVPPCFKMTASLHSPVGTREPLATCLHTGLVSAVEGMFAFVSAFLIVQHRPVSAA
ncbi:unnamed protein product [Pleuronectes platessa]|uniref:Uncharacterized protein n=1 Tax=Pleuronectes platessa TaxID=8262 RepID=A0A9N7VSH8_PLEPL|nr:unnamed protein product [Pleuronectes platessa]